MPHSPNWTVISSREVLDASPFLKVRVETIELPDGRRIPDYYQLEMPSFACIFAETIDGRVIVYRQYRHGTRRVGLVLPLVKAPILRILWQQPALCRQAA
jgi:ADP-ribose pyrophosphatase